MAISGNPILDELDNLSPQAKTALQQAHTSIAGAGPSADVPTAPLPPRPMPVPGATPLIRGLGPAPSSTPAQPALIAHPNPNLATLIAEQKRLTTGDTGKSGIAQIHNGFGRNALKVADAIGAAFFPGLEMALPGTEGHHQLLVRENARDIGNVQQQEANETKNAETAALGNEANARAYSLEHPATPVDKNIGTTLDTDQGIMQWNPATQRYDILSGKEPAKPEAVHPPITDDQGNLWMQHPDGSVTPVMANGKQLKGKPATERIASPEQQYIDEYQKLHPGSTIAQALHQYGIDTQRPQQGPQILMMVPNTEGGATATVVRPGQTVAPGATTAAGFNANSVADAKEAKAAEKARNDAQKEYNLAKDLVAHPSPANDLALVMRYIGATKPDSIGKLRLNQNEINLVLHTRSAFGDVEALANKVRKGTMLTQQQRQDMLDTMKTLTGASESGVNDLITVKVGSQKGQIHASQWERFKHDNPTAERM